MTDQKIEWEKSRIGWHKSMEKSASLNFCRYKVAKISVDLPLHCTETVFWSCTVPGVSSLSTGLSCTHVLTRIEILYV